MQEIARVAKTLAGVVDFKKIRRVVFCVAGAGISGFVMRPRTHCVTWLRISCHGNVTQQGPFRVAVTGVRMPRLNFFRGRRSTFEAYPLKTAKTYCNSEAKRLVNMSFLTEVSQKRFVFELQSVIFEGGFAENEALKIPHANRHN